MPESIEQQVLTKLDQLVRILTISVTKDLKQRDQIALLDRAGLPPKEIAALVGTTSNTVSVELHAIRKLGKKGAQKARTK